MHNGMACLKFTVLTKLTVAFFFFAAVLHTHLTHLIFTVLANTRGNNCCNMSGDFKVQWNAKYQTLNKLRPGPIPYQSRSEDVSLKQLPCVSASHAYHDFQLPVMNFLLDSRLHDRGQRREIHFCAKFTIEKTLTQWRTEVGGGRLGVQIPRNSEGPPKFCQTQSDCENC